MDQDDRQDGNTNSTENTTPRRIIINSPKDPGDDFRTMAHAKTEVSVPDAASDTEPAEIKTMETATVDAEVEPTTVAFTPEQPAPSGTPKPNSPEASVLPQGIDSQTTVAPAVAATPAAVSAKDKKRLILVAVAMAVLFALVGVLVWWVLVGNNDAATSQSDSTLSSSTEQVKLGVALTVADGTVEYSMDAAEWQVASTSSQLKEGHLVRTGTESRAVLALDDGSAVRLDENTTVKLASLSVDSVKVEQVEGSVYSRIVPSERTYTVVAGESTYEALGTAFVTVKSNDENGVQVYESSVKASDTGEAVVEGKQFYKLSGNASLQGKLTDIDLNALIDDAFLEWNLTQDESDNNFKERLGILAELKEMKAERIAELKALEEQRQKDAAEKALLEKQQIEEKKEAHTSSGKVTRGTMTLEVLGDDKTLSWSYTGKAIYGYKVVYAKNTSSLPTFGTHSSIYFSSMSTTTGQLPKKSEIGGGDYKVRVCAYTAGTEDEQCVDYSNHVEIDI